MTSTLAAAVQMNGASFAQNIGIAVARQQIAAERSVADLVAQGVSSAPAPAGQGQRVDIKI